MIKTKQIKVADIVKKHLETKFFGAFYLFDFAFAETDFKCFVNFNQYSWLYLSSINLIKIYLFHVIF